MNRIPLNFTMETERLYLRAINVEDVDFVWSASRCHGFNDGLTWEPPEDRTTLIQVAEMNLDAWKKGEAFMFTSELGEGGNRIGRTGIRAGKNPDEWSFGFWIHPDHWGKGYATEAGLAVLKFGFSHLCASRIFAAHAVWNTRSKRVIDKLGFSYTGENPCGFEKAGRAIAEYEYEIYQADF